MQITNSLLSTIANESPAPKASPRQTSRAQDQVQISSFASRLSKLSQLQTSYEAGTYNVSPSQIANSILNDAML